ncbi:MAG: SH3 domain-containing protein [Pseudomonadota bacterium]
MTIRKMRWALAACALLWLLPSMASDAYWLVRDTTLRSQPLFSAQGQALSQGTEVELVKEEGAWYQVSTDAGQKGWLRRYEMRRASGGATVSRREESSVLGSLMRSTSRLFGRSASEDVESGVVATIGVRGLSEEELKRAQPDYQGVDRLEQWAANTAQAQKLAANGGLKARRIESLKGEK